MQIESLLESEGNQAYEADKFNWVDILVKNANGELVVIEIQNENFDSQLVTCLLVKTDGGRQEDKFNDEKMTYESNYWKSLNYRK